MISLGDEELQTYLQRIFLHTLPDVFDQLQLDDDHNQSYDDDPFINSSMGSRTSSEEAEKKMGSTTIHDSTRARLYTLYQPSSGSHAVDLGLPSARHTSANFELAQKAMETKTASAATVTSTPRTSSVLSRQRASPPHERPPRKVAWATLPQDIRRRSSVIFRRERDTQVGPCSCAEVIAMRAMTKID